jgi:tungstate transport system substrate-binding protein
MLRTLIATLLTTLCLASAASAEERLKLATTTSTENSGLLAHLLPAFEQQCGCKVDVIAVGTGQALKLGSRGDVDLVMVHAPDLERAFVDQGHGVGRRTFMRNHFVIVGPPADPARVRDADSALDAMTRISRGTIRFISRGDESGTHHREKQLWQAAGVKPAGEWYVEAGRGMGGVLTMAGNMEAYTLSDMGTFLSFSADLPLQALYTGDPPLENPYSVIAVDPERFDWVQADLAHQLIDWLCSEPGQALIGAYRIGDRPLFEPLIHPGT